MSINQLIASGIQQPRFESPINMMAQLSQLEAAREANELRRMQMQKLQREESQLNALGQLASRGQPLGLADVAPFGQQGLALLKAQRELSTAAETEEERKQQRQIQRLGTFGKALSQVGSDPSDENLMAVRQSLSEIGISGPEIDRRFGALQLLGTREDRRPALQQMLMSIPGLPEYIAKQNAEATETALKAAQAEKALAEARQAGAPKPTADMQNYEEARRQGFQGTFMDYKQALRPQGTTIQMPPGEKAEDTARGAGFVKEEQDIAAAARTARRQLTSIESAQQAIDAGFRTGFGTEVKAKAANFLSALGVADARKFATDAQTFLQAIKENVLAKQLEQKGVQTNQDAERIEQTFAQFGNTPEANQFILDVARAQAKRAIEQDQFYRKWVAENKTMRGATDAWFQQEGDKSIFERPELQKYVPKGRGSVGGETSDAVSGGGAGSPFSLSNIEAELKRRGVR